jgi:hypothetical protein
MFTGLGLVIACLAGIAIGRATVIGLRDLSSGQEQLDAYKRIEQAPAYRDNLSPRPVDTIDLNAAERDKLAHTSSNDRPS